MDKIKTVIVLGAPKTATGFLAEFFETSENFEVIYGQPGVMKYECLGRLFSVKNLEYKFAKTPEWILDKKHIDRIVEFLADTPHMSLLGVCVREFNYLLRSFYNMRITEGWFLKSHKNKKYSFEEFLNLRSAENHNKTYEECVLTLKENILYLISLVENESNIKLAVFDQLQFKNNSTLEMFKQLGVDIVHKTYRYKSPKIKTNIDYDENGIFHKSYLSLINDERIKKHMLLNYTMGE